MQSTTNNKATWDDVEIVQFSIIRKRIVQCYKLALYLFFILSLSFIIITGFRKKDLFCTKISSNINILSSNIGYYVDYIFASKLERISIKNNNLIPNLVIKNTIQELSINNISSHSMRQIINKIKENALVKDVIISVDRVNKNKLNIHIIEYKIIAANKNQNGVKCLVESSGGLICKYLDVDLSNENIINVENARNTQDIIAVYNHVQKSNLIKNISSINFTESGRFDIVLKNNIVLKMPRQNWQSAIQKFVYLNSKYNIVAEDVEIKYIDFRIEGKLYVGS
jgi:cell division septal protein FtsQ